MSAKLFPISSEKPVIVSKDVAAYILCQGLTFVDWCNVCLLNKTWKKVAHRIDVIAHVYIAEGGFRNRKEQGLEEGYQARIQEIWSWMDGLNGKINRFNSEFINFTGDRHYPLIGLDAVGFANQMACGAPNGQVNIWSLDGEKTQELKVVDAIPLRLFALKIKKIPHLVAVCESTAQSNGCKVAVWKLVSKSGKYGILRSIDLVEKVYEDTLNAVGSVQDATLNKHEIIILYSGDNQTQFTTLALPDCKNATNITVERCFKRLRIGQSVKILEEKIAPNNATLWKVDSLSDFSIDSQALRQKVAGWALVSFSDGQDYLVTEQPRREPPVQVSKVGGGDLALKFNLTHQFGPAHFVTAEGRTYSDHQYIFAFTSDGFIRVWNITDPRVDHRSNQVIWPFCYPAGPEPTGDCHLVPLPYGLAAPDQNGVPQIISPIKLAPLPLASQSKNPLFQLVLLAAIIGFGVVIWRRRSQINQWLS